MRWSISSSISPWSCVDGGWAILIVLFIKNKRYFPCQSYKRSTVRVMSQPCRTTYPVLEKKNVAFSMSPFGSNDVCTRKMWLWSQNSSIIIYLLFFSYVVVFAAKEVHSSFSLFANYPSELQFWVYRARWIGNRGALKGSDHIDKLMACSWKRATIILEQVCVLFACVRVFLFLLTKRYYKFR